MWTVRRRVRRTRTTNDLMALRSLSNQQLAREVLTYWVVLHGQGDTSIYTSVAGTYQYSLLGFA
jgi:hypothetical protein